MSLIYIFLTSSLPNQTSVRQTTVSLEGTVLIVTIAVIMRGLINSNAFCTGCFIKFYKKNNQLSEMVLLIIVSTITRPK